MGYYRQKNKELNWYEYMCNGCSSIWVQAKRFYSPIPCPYFLGEYGVCISGLTHKVMV